jgi:hypothetical protein
MAQEKTQEYRRTLLILSTYCFSTATLFTGTHHVVTYIALLKRMKLTCAAWVVVHWSKTERRWAFPNTNPCQGQLQTSQSVAVFCLGWYKLNYCRMSPLASSSYVFKLASAFCLSRLCQGKVSTVCRGCHVTVTLCGWQGAAFACKLRIERA